MCCNSIFDPKMSSLLPYVTLIHTTLVFSHTGFTKIHPWRYRHGWPSAGKKANTYKYPLTFLKWSSSLVLKKNSLSLQRQFHPPICSTLTNPASKLVLPHVQTITLLEQFKTVPPPSTISKHMKESIRVGSNSQNLSESWRPQSGILSQY